MTKALLIDDEPPACAALRTLLRDHPEITVAGEAGTITEARAALARPGYDLVFLDIQLRGGTGFDLVPHVRPGARVIFVTAYDAHALRAFEVNALDYLMKPVAPARLAAALARLKATATAEGSAPGPLRPDDRVLLKLGSGIERFVRLTDIRLVASNENYSEVSLGVAGEHLLVRKTMKAWEEALPPAQFVRVHRQTIVNVAHVRAIDRVTEATSHLRLDGIAEPVVASYRYLADLRDKLPPH
ncbi:MAG: two component transcriptional regulator, LytTR family [Rariglobus sp.]|jgi:two-component system LytT family response regulator|nr:two component transcriptional regulator, LytTR family [Rariglobus sp.]